MSLLFMFKDSLRKIAGHADVKRVTSTGHDVSAIDLLFHAGNLSQFANDGKLRAPLRPRLSRRTHLKSVILSVAEGPTLNLSS